MPLDDVLQAYDRFLPAFRASGDARAAEVEALLAREDGLKIHTVTRRVKTRESLSRKLARPDKTYTSLWEVTDLVGVRVISYFEDGVERVAQLIERALPVDFVHSIRQEATA